MGCVRRVTDSIDSFPIRMSVKRIRGGRSSRRRSQASIVAFALAGLAISSSFACFAEDSLLQKRFFFSKRDSLLIRRWPNGKHNRVSKNEIIHLAIVPIGYPIITVKKIRSKVSLFGHNGIYFSALHHHLPFRRSAD